LRVAAKVCFAFPRVPSSSKSAAGSEERQQQTMLLAPTALKTLWKVLISQGTQGCPVSPWMNSLKSCSDIAWEREMFPPVKPLQQSWWEGDRSPSEPFCHPSQARAPYGGKMLAEWELQVCAKQDHPEPHTNSAFLSRRKKVTGNV